MRMVIGIDFNVCGTAPETCNHLCNVKNSRVGTQRWSEIECIRVMATGLARELFS